MKDDQPIPMVSHCADTVHRSVDVCREGGGPQNEKGQIARGSMLTHAMVTKNCFCHLLAT